MGKVATHPAQILLLPEEASCAFDEYLDSFEEIPYLLSESVLAGAIGVRRDLLAHAANIAHIFHKACRALHAEIQSNKELQQRMLRALAPVPLVQKTILDDPFFLQYVRMDFFVEKDTLRIIEANSGGGGLTDYLRCVRHLATHFDFSPPEGFVSLEVEHMLSCVADYVQQQRPQAKTLGLCAIENGHEDALCEYLEYAAWLQENTDIEPVLLTLKKGVLSLLSHELCPTIISSIAELDAVFVDWFEDLPCLEQVEKQLRENDVLLVPPRSDLLFENKHFLSVLQTIEKPKGIDNSDWQLLQAALLPSFPLEELEQHIEEMRSWPGCVLKMDIDCASENVFLYDFSTTPLEETLAKLREKHTSSRVHELTSSPTWSVQKLVHPPRLPMNGQSTPDWIDYSYEPYKWDLMTYFCMNKNTPHVLFGSRQFSTEKIDDMTEEGRNDNIFSTVCAL